MVMRQRTTCESIRQQEAVSLLHKEVGNTSPTEVSSCSWKKFPMGSQFGSFRAPINPVISGLKVGHEVGKE